MDNEKTNLIVEYVLISEENLRLSSQVVKAFDDVIKKLVKDFLQRQRDLEILAFMFGET